MYFVVILAIFIHASYGAATTKTGNDDCTKVPPMCHKLHSPKYTKMRLPNMFNHTRYEDVAADLLVWLPLLNASKCNANNQLKFFLCFTYAPVCVRNLIAPCKSFCESVRDSCDTVLRQNNYTWPKFFDCNQQKRFQDDSSRMCINLKMLGVYNINCSCTQYKRRELKKLICGSHFVFRGAVTRTQRRGKQIQMTVSDVFRLKNSKQKISKGSSVTLNYISDTKKCRCNNRIPKKRFLIVGRYVNGKMQADSIKRMKNDKDLRKIIKKCP